MKSRAISIIDTSSFCLAKNVNKQNDDSILPPKTIDNGVLMAIADGVGSYPGAKDASLIAIDFLNQIESGKYLLDFSDIFYKIKEKIIAFNNSDDSFKKAATTLTFAYITNSYLHIGHIGDCRLYIKINNKLVQLTKDHTRYQEQLDQGIFTKKQLLADSHKTKRMLTTAISSSIIMNFNEIHIPISELSLSDNKLDLYLMSDGTHSFWEKRPKFSNNTMNSMCYFSSSLKKRIERIEPEDDYSLVSASIQIS
ncbi:protein phosphatase 2C domain-containing protein [Photobacterium damselae subsp. damselae]|uniref:PP2C family protein-serine/threonine phosphatase n=1 Tax=Photobacterium damselae TaxID=38293 RepID=UPI00311B33CD